MPKIEGSEIDALPKNWEGIEDLEKDAPEEEVPDRPLASIKQPSAIKKPDAAVVPDEELRIPEVDWDLLTNLPAEDVESVPESSDANETSFGDLLDEIEREEPPVKPNAETDFGDLWDRGEDKPPQGASAAF